MGESRLIDGHIQCIAAGVADHDLSSNPTLLANVTPTFSWVRLAQRVPARITLDNVQRGVRLIAGRTASVTFRNVRNHHLPLDPRNGQPDQEGIPMD